MKKAITAIMTFMLCFATFSPAFAHGWHHGPPPPPPPRHHHGGYRYRHHDGFGDVVGGILIGIVISDAMNRNRSKEKCEPPPDTCPKCEKTHCQKSITPT